MELLHIMSGIEGYMVLYIHQNTLSGIQCLVNVAVCNFNKMSTKIRGVETKIYNMIYKII